MSYTGVAPVLPSKVVFRFPGRRCSGDVSDTVPDYYVRTINLASVAGNPGSTGYPATKTFHEYALALFNVGTADPTNKAALDAMAAKFASLWVAWITPSFDRTYDGVVPSQPNPIIDEIIIEYSVDSVSTRVITGVFNDAP